MPSPHTSQFLANLVNMEEQQKADSTTNLSTESLSSRHSSIINDESICDKKDGSFQAESCSISSESLINNIEKRFDKIEQENIIDSYRLEQNEINYHVEELPLEKT